MTFDCIEKIIRRLFGQYGRFLARHPLPFLLLSVLVAGGLGAGMYFLDTESSVEDLYTPDNGRGKTERAYVQQHFPTNDSTSFQATRLINLGRSANVIITSKGFDGNVLSPTTLATINAFNTDIKGIQTEVSGKNYSYADLCSKWSTQCQVGGEDFLDFAVRKNDSVAISYPRTDLSDGSVVFSAGTLGNPSLKTGTDDVEKAISFRLDYYLRTDSPSDEKLSEKWELAFLSYMEKYKSNFINVCYSTSEALQAELAALTTRVIPLFSITFTVLITFSILSCMMLDMVRTKPWLGMLGVLSAGMAIVASMGLCLYCGVKFNSVVASMPFLALGIGVDDLFVMLAAWRKTHPGGSVEERMGETYAEAAVSITITTVTDGLAFGIGAITPIPAVRAFCIFTLAAVVFDYLFQITFFGACMVYIGHREKGNRHATTCMRVPTPDEAKDRSGCFRAMCTGNAMAGVDGNGEYHGSDHAVMVFFRKHFGPFITKWWVKAIVLLIYGAYLGCAIWGCTQVRQGIRLSRLAADDSYVVDFYNKEDQYYGEYGPRVAVIIAEPLNYWEQSTRDQVEKLLTKFEDTDFTFGKTESESWLRDYLAFVNQYSGVIPGLSAATKSSFLSNLSDPFLKNAAFERYAQDIEFNGDKSAIVSSRFFVQTKNIDNSDREQGMMLKMREIADSMSIKTMVYHPTFIFFDQYITILPNTLQNLGIATATMFVVALVLVPHPVCSIWVTLSIASICTGVVGYMTFWDVNLDAISMINIIMCIGFSVDFSAHVTYAFVSCEDKNRNARAVFALYSLGMPILQGALSTILGVSALSTSVSYIFRTFFKTMFLVILLGALHGLVILPVVLTLLGPPCCQKRDKGRKADRVDPQVNPGQPKATPNHHHNRDPPQQYSNQQPQGYGMPSYHSPQYMEASNPLNDAKMSTYLQHLNATGRRASGARDSPSYSPYSRDPSHGQMQACKEVSVVFRK
ncbi:patched domain-containing protein 3-like [Branchiostoma lanceolatum]|uniref:patched domain-containing protein 3-like n=1 Tax=Branchiostoma lanceolatum TaxID=7740 RepID=UPI0034553468